MIDHTQSPAAGPLPEEKRALLAHLLRQQASRPVSERLGLISEEDRCRLPEDVEDAYPLTHLQTGMLFHTEAAPDTAVYHDIFRHHLRCRLEEDAFRQAVRRVGARHPVLRTSLNIHSYGEPLQLVHHSAAIPVEFHDLSHLGAGEQEEALQRWMEEERHRGFDWTRPPLLRLVVHRRSAETFELSQSFHHAILDGWSVASLNTELFQAYLALLGEEIAPLPPPPAIAFRDYVALERRALASDDQRRYWLDNLAGSEATRLPRWPGAQATGTRRIAGAPVPLGRELSDRLKELAREEGVPVKSVLLAAHLAVLRTLGGSDDVVTGLVSNGRPEQTDGDRVIGLFLNSLPFRLQLPGGSWRELARQTLAADRDSLPFRRLPMAEVQNALGGRPLFDVLFTFVNFHVYRSLAGLRGFEQLDARGITETNYDFQVFFYQNPFNGRLGLRLDYNPAVFPEAEVRAIAGYYARTLEEIARDPDGRYDLFSPLSPDERQEILRDWNATSCEVPRARCLPALLAEQARLHPATPAVLYEEEEISFAELSRWTGGLAARLRTAGAGPDRLVALLAERSPGLIAGALAILEAGGAYVYLDPSYPRERLIQLLDDARPAVLLAQEHLLDRLPEGGPCAVVPFAGPAAAVSAAPAPGPMTAEPHAGSLAYAIYTSGSTGRPKGILVQHGSVLNLLEGLERAVYSGLPETGLRVSVNGSLAFDTSVKQLVQIARGRTLCVVPEAVRFDGEALLGWLRRHRIRVFDSTPSQLRLLLEAGLTRESFDPPLVLLVGGEAIDPDTWEALAAAPGIDAFNVYGPAECTVDTTVCRVRGVDGPRLGRPICNARVYVVDAEGLPVPPGVPGEIRIGGDGLARGYLASPGLTAAAFVPDPFGDEPGGRLYRTGDRGRWLPGGLLEFLGRTDHQVKIRGFRVELGEIEAVLGRHPDVSEAAVALRSTEAGGEERLAAYVVPGPGRAPAVEELLAFLGERLPAHMLPAAFVQLTALPLLPNGKLDRAALPVPDSGRPALRQELVAPRTPVERELCALWTEVLQVDQVGLHDNFFAIGGHSLLAVKLILRIRERFGVELSLRSLLLEPTVAGVAEELVRLEAEQADDGLLADLLDEIEAEVGR